MSHDPVTLPSRPLPLIGFLCLMAGGGMLYSTARIAALLSAWEPYPRLIGGVAGLILVLWGARLIVSGLVSGGNVRVGRLGRNRVLLPREGFMYLLIMIVCFVASLVGRSNMLMLVFSIMAGPFIINGWVTYTMLRRNTVTRSTPRRIRAGETVQIELTLTNHKWWFSSWLMTVRDRIQLAKGGPQSGTAEDVLEPAVLFASVRARSSRAVCYQVRLNRRGRHEFGPIEVSTRFPLGRVDIAL